MFSVNLEEVSRGEERLRGGVSSVFNKLVTFWSINSKLCTDSGVRGALRMGLTLSSHVKLWRVAFSVVSHT